MAIKIRFFIFIFFYFTDNGLLNSLTDKTRALLVTVTNELKDA